MTTPYGAPQGWFPDPSGGPFLRYWDGSAWTAHTRPLPGTGTPAVVPGYASAGTGGPGYGYAPPPVGVWRGPVDTRPLVRNMADAVRVCLQKYAQFDGRASRSEFWYAELALFLAAIALVVLSVIPFAAIVTVPALWALSLGTFIPLLAVGVRRLRDAGLSWGWMFLTLFFPGTIVLIVLWAQPSKYP